MLETTEESSTVLHAEPVKPTEASFGRSSYKQKGGGAPVKKDEKCRWCGRSSHPSGKSLDRIHCPARKQSCSSCKMQGHFAVVCEKAASQAARVQDDSTQEQNMHEIPANASVSFGFSTVADFRQDSEPNGWR